MSEKQLASSRAVLLACGALIAAMQLSACHPHYFTNPRTPPRDKALTAEDTGNFGKPDYFSSENLDREFLHERKQRDSNPQDREDYPEDAIGLALSGGGTKAATYALGVIAGLSQNPQGNFGDSVMHEVDVVSTVSGGGYAAYWYFSRLVEDYELLNRATARARIEIQKQRGTEALRDGAGASIAREPQFSRVFWRCVPSYFGPLFDSPPPQALAPVMPDAGVCRGEPTLFDPAEPCDPQNIQLCDKFRFEAHLRGFQDIFSNDFTYDPTTASDSALNKDIAKALSLTLVTLPGHWFANLLFDWRLPVSPSQRQYAIGIERTYGLAPVNCADKPGEIPTYTPDRGEFYGPKLEEFLAFSCEPDPEEPDRPADRPVPNRLKDRGLTFKSLELARGLQLELRERLRASRGVSLESELPKIPFWVVNTTAGVGGRFDLLEDSKLPDFEDSVFEFTPSGFGSGLYGYWPGSHPDMDIAKAVSASAAFFDSQQRAYNQPQRFFQGLTFKLLQLQWGADIANPVIPDRHRGRKAFLPFPLYYFYGHIRSPKGFYVHLSDGGQSDNTGVFSLVRRGVRTIVAVDAASDQGGNFGDLCLLRRKLLTKGLHLHLDLEEFDARCDAVRSDTDVPKQVANLWQSNSSLPIVTGTLSQNPSQAGACSLAQRRPQDYCANLFVLKPSIPMDVLKPHVDECRASLGQREEGETGLSTEACRSAYASALANLPGLPPEVFGFLVRNDAMKGGHWLFPQHSTVRMTLNSSASLFGAYRELGRWHASRLEPVRVPSVREPTRLVHTVRLRGARPE